MRGGTHRGRPLTLVVLFGCLLLVAGFAGRPEMSARQAEQKAYYVPAVHEYVTRPTVQPRAVYDPVDGEWRVDLVEQTSGKTVARLLVSDATGRVIRVEITPAAKRVSYPTLSRGEAIKLAAANPKVRAELSRHPSHTAEASYEDGRWKVSFWSTSGGKSREIAEVEIDDRTWALEHVYTGAQVFWQMARGESWAYGGPANYWYVWGPFALLFAVAFLRNDRLFSLRTLDVAALLGFLVSHAYFRQGIVHPAVLLWYPPLVYLFLRTLLMGFGVGERVERTSNFPAPVLFALGVAASGVLLWLNLGSRVLDVGYAGVAGADRIVHGVSPYGHMPSDVASGDTYGPLNYLLYVPFVYLFGYSGHWDYLPAAHALTIFSYVVGALAMMFCGYRFAGMKGAGALFLAWSAYPYTLYATNNDTNDVLVAAALAVGLALVSSPLARGAVIGAGFAIKLFPLMLGPLWLFYERRLRPGPLIDFALGGLAVLVGSFWVLLLGGNGPIEAAKTFYERTFAFQDGRVTPWTIFTQVPLLEPLKFPLTLALGLLALLVAYFPRTMTVRRLAALSAALVVGFQLVSSYWFYAYITWFEPLVFLALLPKTNEKSALDVPPERLAEDSA